MKINETIKHLQSSIKVRSNLISQEEKERNTMKKIEIAIRAIELITCCFIVAGVIRHWS